MKTHQVIREDGTKISYEISGTGDVLLCFSGFGCSHYNFEYLKHYLEKKFKLILIDNRGMGYSTNNAADFTLETLVEDAMAIIDDLGIKKFQVAGISMGGILAQLTAINYPERVNKLILICTTSSGPDFVPLPKLTEEGLEKMYKFEAQDIARETCLAYVHPENQKNKELFNDIIRLRYENHPDLCEIKKQHRAVERFMELTTDLSKINVDTIIITGDADRFVNPKNSEILNSKIKNSKLVVIEHADHFVFLEKAPQVSMAIMQ